MGGLELSLSIEIPDTIGANSSLSLAIESLPSNWAMHDVLRVSLLQIGEGG